MLTLGQKKVVQGACEQESEEKKFKIQIFEHAKLDFCKKKFASANFLKKLFDYAFMYTNRSGSMSRIQN